MRERVVAELTTTQCRNLDGRRGAEGREEFAPSKNGCVDESRGGERDRQS